MALAGLMPDSLRDLTWTDENLGVQHLRFLDVVQTVAPSFNDRTHKLGDKSYSLNETEDGVIETYSVVELSTEELSAKVEQAKQAIVSAVQSRLDTFAQTRNYGSILSDCTYASSTVAQFAQEGQLCVNLRDATWGKLYQIMQEVEAGTRPMPVSIADIESELPKLAWTV
jgi:hypothetical protein